MSWMALPVADKQHHEQHPEIRPLPLSPGEPAGLTLPPAACGELLALTFPARALTRQIEQSEGTAPGAESRVLQCRALHQA